MSLRFKDFFCIVESIENKLPILLTQFPDFKKEFIVAASEADPTLPKAVYITWILRQLKNKSVVFPEDIPKVKGTLEQFDYLKIRGKFKDNKDINSYKTYSDLADVIDKYTDVNKDGVDVSGLVGVKKFGEVGEYTIYLVTDATSASIMWKEPLTRWCVRFPETFHHYVKSYGDPNFWCVVQDGVPYRLLHLGSSQFADPKDVMHPIGEEPALKSFFIDTFNKLKIDAAGIGKFKLYKNLEELRGRPKAILGLIGTEKITPQLREFAISEISKQYIDLPIIGSQRLFRNLSDLADKPKALNTYVANIPDNKATPEDLQLIYSNLNKLERDPVFLWNRVDGKPAAVIEQFLIGKGDRDRLLFYMDLLEGKPVADPRTIKYFETDDAVFVKNNLLARYYTPVRVQQLTEEGLQKMLMALAAKLNPFSFIMFAIDRKILKNKHVISALLTTKDYNAFASYAIQSKTPFPALEPLIKARDPRIKPEYIQAYIDAFPARMKGKK